MKLSKTAKAAPRQLPLPGECTGYYGGRHWIGGALRTPYLHFYEVTFISTPGPEYLHLHLRRQPMLLIG